MRVLYGGKVAAVHSDHVGSYAFKIRPGTVDVDAIRETWSEDVYQLGTVDWSRDADDKAPVVVDVGAHIGAVTVWCALAGADVYAYEPSEDNIDILAMHVPGESRGVCRWMRSAVGPLEGHGRVAEIGDTGMLNVDGFSELPQEEQTVKVVTLRNAIANALETSGSQRIRLLKVDIEGGEYETFLHCPVSSVALCDRIMIETHPTDVRTLGTLLANLGQTHGINYFGAAENGGMIYARRY